MTRARKECPVKFTGFIYFILSKYPGINTHALMKIAYLLELGYLQYFGEKLTEVKIIRLERGPVYTNHNNLLERMEYHGHLQMKPFGRAHTFYPGEKPGASFNLTPIESDVFNKILSPVDEIIEQHPISNWEFLKDLAYSTFPMKRFQEFEDRYNSGKKYFGKDLLVSPYFVKKRDCSPDINKNKMVRENERIRMQTSLDIETKDRLASKLDFLKNGLQKLAAEQKAHPPILPSSSEKKDLKKYSYIQSKAVKSLLEA